MYKTQEAIDKALFYGATLADIEKEAELQARHVGSVPFNNMIKALNMLPWQNYCSDWIRLAGALQARSNAKKLKK